MTDEDQQILGAFYQAFLSLPERLQGTALTWMLNQAESLPGSRYGHPVTVDDRKSTFGVLMTVEDSTERTGG